MVIVLSSSPMHHGFVAISAWKWCSVHLCLRLIVKGGISCLGFLFLLAHSGVQHIMLCFVFLRLLYPVLPVSLDGPFLVVPSVFSNVYL
jgi:hypothetical protein